jgi:hypothetical protein
MDANQNLATNYRTVLDRLHETGFTVYWGSPKKGVASPHRVAVFAEKIVDTYQRDGHLVKLDAERIGHRTKQILTRILGGQPLEDVVEDMIRIRTDEMYKR